MSRVSIAEARNHLPRLVQEAEAGEPVSITRRGRPVAVLLSEQAYARLLAPREGIVDFLHQWRAEVAAQGAAFADGSEFEDLRDHTPARPIDWE